MLSASVCSPSTLLMAFLLTLFLSSLPPPFSWQGPPLPDTCTCSQYMLAVPQKNEEREGKRMSQILSRQETGKLKYEAHYNMRQTVALY